MKKRKSSLFIIFNDAWPYAVTFWPTKKWIKDVSTTIFKSLEIGLTKSDEW